TMRPRPGDQLFPSEQNLTPAQVQTLVQQGILFPAPTDQYGDVRNLPGTGPNDSIWIDLGYPVGRLKFSNRYVKPLFAILVVDLDNRINLNVSGNAKEAADLNYHGSHQGWGRWEINPNKLMVGPTPEYLNLFRGNTVNGTNYSGRFGFQANTIPDQPPGMGSGPGFFPVPDRQSQITSGAGYLPKNYSRVDYDGSRYALPPGPPPPGPPYPPPYAQAAPPNGNVRFVMPNGMTTAFPNFDPLGPGGGTRYGDGNIPGVERQYHPSLFNPFNLNLGAGFAYTDQQADQNLPIGDLRFLLRYDVNYGWTPVGTGQVPNELRNSRIGKLWPNLLYSDQGLWQKITPYSVDMDVAGAAPCTVEQAGSPGGYQMDMKPARPLPGRVPQSMGQQVTFGVSTPPNPVMNLLVNRQGTPNPGGDLRNNDWRSILPDLGRVDLNRPLTSYPNAQNTLQPG